MRTCRDCGEAKPDDEMVAGSANWCRDCRAIYQRAYMQANYPKYRAQMIAASKLWHQNNRERAKESSKKWLANNAEKAKQHARKNALKYRYGMTIEEFDNLLAWSNGGCAICGATTDLHIDHDHKTNEIRAILCGGCNRGLGQFRDRIDLLKIAAVYLEYFTK